VGRNFSKLVLALVICVVVFLLSTRSGHSMLGGRVATDFVDALVYASPDCASGGWEQGDDTEGLTVYALASHPGSPNVYAGSWGEGVYAYVMDSDENSWWQTPLGFPMEISSLAIDPASPTIVYAGTMGNGLRRSINGGEIWREITDLKGKEVWSLAITSTVASIYAYAGAGPGEPFLAEIYTSTNGIDWDLAGGTEIGTEKFYAIAVDPQESKIAYVGTKEEGVYRTENGGQSWKLSGEELDTMTVRALAIRPDDSDIIYAGTKSHGIFKSIKSTDGGASWSLSGLDGYDVFAIAINPGNPEFIYAGTHGEGVWVSYNGGYSWHRMSGLAGNAGFVYSLTLFTPEGEDDYQVLYAGTRDGVWARAVTPFYTLYLPLVYKE